MNDDRVQEEEDDHQVQKLSSKKITAMGDVLTKEKGAKEEEEDDEEDDSEEIAAVDANVDMLNSATGVIVQPGAKQQLHALQDDEEDDEFDDEDDDEHNRLIEDCIPEDDDDLELLEDEDDDEDDEDDDDEDDDLDDDDLEDDEDDDEDEEEEEDDVRESILHSSSAVSSHSSESSSDDRLLERMEINEDIKDKIHCPTSAGSNTDSNLCNCEDCGWKNRDISADDLQEMMNLRHRGMDLRQYVRHTFNYFMETSGFSLNSATVKTAELENVVINPVELQESVALLCDRVPYHLFMWLVGQAQEFIMGVKVQLLTLLYDRSIDNLAEVFITKLLDGYDALLATAVHISGLLEPLHKELFSKVNLSWECINKILYQNYVYSDPLIQNNLLPFIGQLRKHLPTKGTEYHDLVHRYLAFDKEITKTGTLCPEIERLIDKYNAEQVTDTVMKKVREDFERFRTRLKVDQEASAIDPSVNKLDCIEDLDECCATEENNVDSTSSIKYSFTNEESCAPANSVEIQSMFNDWKKSPQQRLADLVEALNLSSSLDEEDEEEDEDMTQVILNDDITSKKSGATDNPALEASSKMDFCDKKTCKCHSNKISSNDKICYTPKLQDSQEIPAIIKKPTQSIIENLDHKMHTESATIIPPIVASEKKLAGERLSSIPVYPVPKQQIQHINAENNKEPQKKVLKTTVAQSAQTQTRHSTTQTPNLGHNNQPHTHRHHHQGRLSPGDNADGSDSGSSHDDSCSATNSPTPKESNRHCDCCYCEVFGHGVPSVAPVSRNYTEMRERLRQLLSKKKAKCKSICNPHTKPSVEVSSSSSSLSSSSSMSSTSSTITNVDSANLHHSASRSITPVATKCHNKVPVHAPPIPPVGAMAGSNMLKPGIKQQYDQWSLEAAIEFVEGNHGGKKDSKKAEKKARQKQKKQIEEKLKKEKEEEEQQKIIELQKKTPEVTITVVSHQQKQLSQKSQQKRTPEVSTIVPTNTTSKLSTVFSNNNNNNIKQTNAANKKLNKNPDSIVNSNNNLNNNIANSKVKNNAAKLTDNNRNNKNKTEKSKEVVTVQPKLTPEEIVASINNDPNAPKLSKKERKKIKRELEKQEAMKYEGNIKSTITTKTGDNQVQVVTIKRVMVPNHAEPTVTITLKGQTPDEDRVLFTLVNGQPKDPNAPQNESKSKKKKNKSNNATNQQIQPQQQNQKTKSQSQVVSSKASTNANIIQGQKSDNKNIKQPQVQTNITTKSSKNLKQQQEKQITVITETKTNKTKKDKKSTDNKENISRQPVVSQQQEASTANTKKGTKSQAGSQNVAVQKSQQMQQQSAINPANKASKNANKNQNKTSISNINAPKNLAKTTNVNTNQGQINISSRIDNQQKVAKPMQNAPIKQQIQQHPNVNVKQQQQQNLRKEQQYQHSESYSQSRSSTASSSISIENLKLPPGITITKVDAPTKPMPIKSNSNIQKPVNNTPKQTTIIAAPMSGMQSTSNYGSNQGAGNVIIVDTGRLKQDLVPKNSDKDISKDSSKKKKKKAKNKVNAVNSVPEKTHTIQATPSKITMNDYLNVEPARISHNPSTNMVTIRNPAFGPPQPKVEPQNLQNQQQQAIIKVAENGMVTIRSPALQHAINSGLAPPSKPDYIVKGDIHSQTAVGTNDVTMVRNPNGIPTDLSEFRRRLTKPENPTSQTLYNSGLSNIQISKVTNGQNPPIIPENGINLKGTSVTLTKIRNPSEYHQPRQPTFEDFKPPSMLVNSNAGIAGDIGAMQKNRKKKKRGNTVRPDDWNLVESVFTPKDDLEDGEMDDAERELEAFKRFCLQSVPPPRKEKVNLNIKDIVLKKKSSSTSTAAVLAAT